MVFEFNEFIKEINKQATEKHVNVFPLESIVQDYKNRLLDENAILAEFGVYSGRTINYIARVCAPNVIHGFDSFFGLPETWRNGFEQGFFNCNGIIPYVENNVKLHIGLFDKTIPAFKNSIGDRNISFMHIDCDLYSSTKTIFDLLGDNITNTIIEFDELINYDGYEQHEILALWEFLKAHDDLEMKVLYANGEQVSVYINKK